MTVPYFESIYASIVSMMADYFLFFSLIFYEIRLMLKIRRIDCSDKVPRRILILNKSYEKSRRLKIDCHCYCYGYFFFIC